MTISTGQIGSVARQVAIVALPDNRPGEVLAVLVLRGGVVPTGASEEERILADLVRLSWDESGIANALSAHISGHSVHAPAGGNPTARLPTSR